jgi:hypothetical protein
VQVGLGLAVVEDPAAAEHEQVEPLDLVDQLAPYRIAGDDAVHVVPGAGLLRIAGEDRELHVRHVAAELLHHRREDGLVADVQPPVGPADADDRLARWFTHPGEG